MSINIPTIELVGCLADVLPFASSDKDLKSFHAVRIWWDGQNLHTEATDRYTIGRAEWRPGDDPEIDEQEPLGTEWGGADNPWSALISFDDAKKIVGVFKLPPKRGWTQLTLDMLPDGRLKIMRHRDTGFSAITQTIQPIAMPYPSLDKILLDGLFPVPVGELAFSARTLAGFAKVRQRGPVEMTFTGDGRSVLVKIGARFVGAIMPVRGPVPTEKPATQPAETVSA